MRLIADDVPLDDRRFRRIFAAEAISRLGTFMAPVALVFAVLEISDAAGVGIVLAAREIPLVVLLLGGGVLADRRSPRALMIAADAARFVTQGLTAALLIAGHAELWHLVVLQAIAGGAQAFELPAQTGLIADVVAPARLQAANSLRAFASSLGNIAGPALAGVLVVATSPGWAVAADAATFAISGLLLATVAVVHRPTPRLHRHMLADLLDGWRAFRASDWLWGGVTVMSLWNAAFAVFRVAGPVVAGTAGVWAAVMTATGIGAVAGGLVLVRVRPRRPGVLLAAGLLVSCLPALALAAGAPTAVAVVGAVLAGAGSIGFNATWESTVQREVPRESLSRVMAYDMFGSFALAPLGFAFGGLLVDPLGATTTLFAAGILLGGLAAMLWAIPGIRRLRAPV
jgi:predicted MFS family arabinose efflux permease